MYKCILTTLDYNNIISLFSSMTPITLLFLAIFNYYIFSHPVIYTLWRMCLEVQKKKKVVVFLTVLNYVIN